jgi:Ca2+/Na+ antiporter
MDVAMFANGIAVISCAILFGGMLTFSAFFAPMVFRMLPDEVASPFMRDIFPIYYMLMMILAAVTGAMALVTDTINGTVMGLVALGFAGQRWYLMPQAHEAHDARERGVIGAADTFADIHRRSAFLNFMQFLATLVILLRLAT